MIGYGTALLEADTARIGAVTALGLDETLFARTGRYRRREWATSVVDVGTGVLLDMVEGRTAIAAADWLEAQPDEWLDQIAYATLDLSGPYRAAFNQALPDAVQVADPFHVVRVATQALDEVRRRVQQDTTGHRSRAGDPLYRIRRPLTMASERLDDEALTRLRGHLAVGDPHGEVRNAWHAREVVRSIYTEPHTARVTNGPTEAINNLLKRVKRAAFGMKVFAHYRIRALLYAGRPNWALLATITPR